MIGETPLETELASVRLRLEQAEPDEGQPGDRQPRDLQGSLAGESCDPRHRVG